ncbi:hypothetical protein [Streptomyces sp. NBC_00158]
MDTVLGRPEVVAEISDDRTIDRGGVYRQPVRFKPWWRMPCLPGATT